MSPDFRKVALIAAVLGLLVSLYFALNRQDEQGGLPVITGVVRAAESDMAI